MFNIKSCDNDTVVVFPFVPVTPISFNFFDGFPKKLQHILAYDFLLDFTFM